MTNRQGLNLIGKAIAEMEKASWFIGTEDKEDFEKAYSLLRKSILGRHGLDLAKMYKGRLTKRESVTD